MTTAVHNRADPKAVAVARAVYDAVRPDSVILFGSRARGDYRPDSDIDLLVISDDHASRAKRMKAQKTANETAHRIYGDYWMGTDVVWMPRAKYDRCRGGINHLAARAARDGVDMNGEKQEYERDRIPFDWADIRQRVINTDRNLGDLETIIAGGGSQEAIEFFAQQALENILKGWISAFGGEYENIHDLERLIGIIRNSPDEMDTPAGAELIWLTQYAVEYRYEGARLLLDDPIELHNAIDLLAAAISDRIKTLTGAEELPRYTPPTRRREDEPTDADAD